jgi:hypothetical protein
MRAKPDSTRGRCRPPSIFTSASPSPNANTSSSSSYSGTPRPCARTIALVLTRRIDGTDSRQPHPNGPLPPVLA